MFRSKRKVLAVLVAIFGSASLLIAVFGSRSDIDNPEPQLRGLTEPAQASNKDADPPRTVHHVPYNRVVALVIGINEYPNLLEREDLGSPQKEVDSIAEILNKRYGYSVISLKGVDASKNGILQALDHCNEEVGEKDALIVYFAGHGRVIELPSSGDAGFLVPSDARINLRSEKSLETWEREAINMNVFVNRINRMSARHVLLIVDACSSGYFTSAARGSISDPDTINFLSQPARTVLSSTSRRQPAKDGLFAPVFARLLCKYDDDASVASVYDLHYHLSKEVSSATAGKMTPQVVQVGDGDGLFVFVPSSIPQGKIDAAFRDVNMERHNQIKHFTSPKEVYQLTTAVDARAAKNGLERHREAEERFNRFLRNAELGDPWATAALHYCYEKGVGTDKDLVKAYQMAMKSDRMGSPPGLGKYLLGRCYELGFAEHDTKENLVSIASGYYKESAELGNLFGRAAFAKSSLASGKLSPEQITKCRDELRIASEAGIQSAQLDYALEMYENRPENKSNELLTISLFEKAATDGISQAAYYLYRSYAYKYDELRWSKQPDKDNYAEKARKYLLQAADQGNVMALQYLGYYYLEKYKLGKDLSLVTIRRGLDRWLETADIAKFRFYFNIGIAPDIEKGKECWIRSAHGGNTVAMLNLGLLYKSGKDVAIDHQKVREWIDLAVKEKNVEANFVKGLMLLKGEVYPRNDEDAFRHFKTAADKKHPAACCALGIMFLNERGIPKSFPIDAGGERSALTFLDDPVYKYWSDALHYFVITLQYSNQLDADNNEPSVIAQEYLTDFAMYIKYKQKRTIMDYKDKRVLAKIVESAEKRNNFNLEEAAKRALERWRRDNPETAKTFEKSYKEKDTK